ncbi:response regulator [Oleisolibacter albus]|uniref:response regulator n=1 Tax=Oleisolibacter albus TaxID=2171757 RepID=UPI000DF183BB|nr:response regulator [Oleisolibacter albus]
MEAQRHILVVDDDPDLCELLHAFLLEHGFRVSTAGNGTEMARLMARWPVDAVVLDVMLPGEDGTALCRQLRARSNVPIIMLTAMRGEADRIVGLELGADDYVVKPFSPRELLARIRAVMRRSGTARAEARPKTYGFDGWTLDEGRRELRAPDGTLIHLSSGEYRILGALLRRPQQVVAREELLELHRGAEAGPFDRSVDIQVSRLRRKLEAGGASTELIKSVRGVGYVLSAPVEEQDRAAGSAVA